jgi:hypothetical protein
MVHENLGLVLEPPECGAVDDAIAIALEFAARRRRRLGEAPPSARTRLAA